MHAPPRKGSTNNELVDLRNTKRTNHPPLGQVEGIKRERISHQPTHKTNREKIGVPRLLSARGARGGRRLLYV